MANITGSIQVRPIYTPTSRQALFPPPITRTPPRCNTEVGLSFVYQEGGISRQIWSLDMSLSVCTPAPIAVTPLNYQRRHDIVCALQLYLHGTQSVTEANIIPGSWTLPWKNGLVFSQSFQIPMGCCHPNYRKALEGVGIITRNGVPSSRDVSHRQFWVINWTAGWANKHFQIDKWPLLNRSACWDLNSHCLPCLFLAHPCFLYWLLPFCSPSSRLGDMEICGTSFNASWIILAWSRIPAVWSIDS